MDRHMRAAFARWPDLTDAEIKWAIERAAAISRREGNRATAEAKAIEAAIGGGEQT
jgi:hypothetical protein